MSRRRRLVRLAAWTLASVAIGLLAGWYLGVAGVAAGPVWIAVVVAVQRALIRYRFPARCREMTRRFVDPSAGPPPGTEPVALDAPRTWADAITAKDWRAARAVLAEDLAVVNAVDPGRYGRTVYMRAMRMIALAFPDLRIEVDEVVGRPAAPEIAWVRFSELGHSRRGPAIDATWWERWTLDAERRRVREIALEGVTRFA